MKDCEVAWSTGDSSLAADPADGAPPPTAEAQCVCWMCSVSEDSVRKPMEHWLQKKAWFPSAVETSHCECARNPAGALKKAPAPRR